MDNKIYIPRIKIRSEGRIYKPGEQIYGIPDTDMEYLIRSGFVREVCTDPGIDAGRPVSATNPAVENDEEEERLEFFTEEQLKKLPSKAAIISYAESIGLPGLDEKLHKTELIDAVLAYIAEVENDVI